MDTSETANIELSYLTMDDYAELKSLMLESYPSFDKPYWEEKHIKKLISVFPEGQIVARINSELAGCALSIIIDSKSFPENHTYEQVTAQYSFNSHTDDGDRLYGIDIFVKPKFRGLRLGRRLYDYRKELCERLNLRGIAFGGRIPNYHKYAHEISPKEYIDRVKRKEIHDPVFNFQMSNDFQPTRIIKNYLRHDEESNDYAILLEWENIFYENESDIVDIKKKIVRIGLVQWQMRPYKNLEDLLQQVEFFVDAVSAYRCDFALFPEFFNAPLMAKDNHLNEPQAIRNMAKHTEPIVSKFMELAITYNINIITGSMPEIKDERLYNVGYLCHRDGRVERYEKIHVTPDEYKVWGLSGGHHIQTYNTDCGKIGILICYDVEFPELSRLLADEGMDILFVPFLTDTQNAYTRVKVCAQARAVENECYVAISGCVGNLPNVHNMDIQYANSMVFTPCDFSFPANGIKAESTPNAEMIVIADVDIYLLRELNKLGSVRNRNDRRLDIYDLKHADKKR